MTSSSLQLLGPMALGTAQGQGALRATSFGCHGNQPKAHGPPGGGGEIQSREAGERWLVNPGVPPVVHPPRSGLPRKLGEHMLPRVLLYSRSSVPISPIFTSHIVDSFLPIACCRLQSSILLKLRPPEELLHQTCRAFRGESDSSTLEVVRRLLGGSS